MTDGDGDRQAHGRLFWISLVAAWAVIGFGLVSLLTHARATRPLAFTAYLLGSVFVHDFVLVPMVLAVGVLAGRRLPGTVRGPVLGGLVVSGVLILASYPVLRGSGRLAGNPSLLPRDYAAGLLLVLLAVWGVTAILVVATIRHRGGARATVGRDEGRATPDHEPSQDAR